MFLGVPYRFLRTAVFGVLVCFVLAPVVALPYRADDSINRNWPLRPLGDQFSEVMDLVVAWMQNQGRFFPGSALYGLMVWNGLPSRAAYATYLALLGLACIGLFVVVAWCLTRSAHLAALAGFGAAMCFQVRFVDFDGLAGFAGLVPYTIVLTLISGMAAAVVLRGGSRWWVWAIAVPWTLAITSYEVSLLMLPALFVVLWGIGPALRTGRVRWLWAGLPLIVPAVLQMGITLFLRQQPLSVAPAYQLNPGGPVWSTTGKQFVAGLPFSQEMLGGNTLDIPLTVLLVVCLAIPAVLVWRPWAGVTVRMEPRLPMVLMIAGGWAWLVPSLLAGVTQRWQESLTWGVGYIYVVYEFMGVALIIVGAGAWLAQRGQRPWARVAFAALFCIVVGGCAVAAAANLAAIGMFVPGPAGPG